MTQIDKLLPCPFCGEPPVLDDSCRDITIKCSMCGAEPRYSDLHEDQTKRLAIKAWNTRHAYEAAKPKGEAVDVGELIVSVMQVLKKDITPISKAATIVNIFTPYLNQPPSQEEL